VIFGIGCDIVNTERFKNLIDDKKFLLRYFNEKELPLEEKMTRQALCEHYASRFAAKEAFSKALGTGFKGFKLKDVFVEKEEGGKPFISVEKQALEIKNKMCGNNASVFLSISHEKENVVAIVVIERG
jgi:holo-[acyl-carrier protein] synthase